MTQTPPPLEHGHWAQRLQAEAARADGPAPPLPGRILRAKLGYNPNSSSIGSLISVLLWSSAFAAVAINILQGVVARQALGAHPRPALPSAGDQHSEATAGSAGETVADERPS